MGTISQKLTYLNETKNLLKTQINYGLPTEEQITSSTTFRNYVSSIFNAFLEALRTPDTLFTNLPKKSGTGANITLNDTANAPMRIELGATELTQAGTPTPSSPQDIHTISGSNTIKVIGKNYFHISSATPVANSTCNIISDNAISITNLNNQNYRYATIPIEVEANTTYYFKANVSNSNSSVTNVWFSVWNENKTATLLDTSYTSGTTKNFNTGSNTKLSVGIYATGGGGLSNTATWSEIQLTKANNDTYTPYVSQEADIDLKSRNMLNDYNLTNRYKIANIDGNVLTTNSSSADWDTFQPMTLFQKLSLVQGNDYYVSFDMRLVSGTYTGKVGQASLMTTGGTALSSGNVAILQPNMSSSFQRMCYKTTASSTTTERIAIMIQIQTGASNAVFEIKNIMISTSNDYNYQPYYDYGFYGKIGTYEDKFIRTSGKNLFDGTFNHLAFYDTAVGESMSFTENSNYLGAYCKVEPGKTYSISKIETTNRFRIALSSNIPANGGTGLEVGRDDSATKIENITIPSGYNYLSIYLSNSSGSSTGINIMINEGTTALDYEPYGSNEWYIKKNIGKVVLDGTQSGLRTPTSNAYRFCIDLGGNAITTTASEISNIISNKFTGISRDNTYSNIQGIAYSDSGKNYKDLIIYCDDTKNMTYAEFKTWLSSNNVSVYYILLTPTYTQITGTLAEQLENVYKNMLSQEGTTNISQVNNDLAFILNVSAIEEL